MTIFPIPERRSSAEYSPSLPLLVPAPAAVAAGGGAGRGAAEERVVLHALLPEVLAVVAVLKVELDRVLVVALEEEFRTLKA